MSPEITNTPLAAAEFKRKAAGAAERGIVVRQKVSPQFAALALAIPAGTLRTIGIAALPTKDNQVEFIFSAQIFPIIQEAVRISLEDENGEEDQLKLKAALYRAIYTLVQQQLNAPLGFEDTVRGRHGKLIAAAAETIPELAGIIDASGNPSRTKALTDIELIILQSVASGFFDDVQATKPELLQNWVNQGRTPENMFTRVE